MSVTSKSLSQPCVYYNAAITLLQDNFAGYNKFTVYIMYRMKILHVNLLDVSVEYFHLCTCIMSLCRSARNRVPFKHKAQCMYNVGK